MVDWHFIIPCFGELIGTMILVLLGNGACFATSHSKLFAINQVNE